MQVTEDTTWGMGFDEPGMMGFARDPAALGRVIGPLGQAAEELDRLLAEARGGGCPVYLEAASSAVHLALVALRSCELDPPLREQRLPGA